MNADLVTITLHLEGQAPLAIHELSGVEGTNLLYAFDLDLSSPSSSLDFAELVGAPAVVTIERGEQRRYVHGLLGSLEQAETGGFGTRYHATVVPSVWLLSQGTSYRILQGLSSPQVIERVLSEAGYQARRGEPQGQRQYRLSLRATYAPRELCIQYGESDWAFLCRLMEDGGISYFFEHGEGGSTLVITDHGSAFEPIGTPADIPYVVAGLGDGHGDGILSFRFTSRIRPDKVAVLDVPFDTPARRLEQEARSGRSDQIALRAYPSTARASHLLDAAQVTRNVATGVASSVRLVPGSTFELSRHPRASFDAAYLLTRVEHTLSGDAEGVAHYTARFECILKDTPCRPDARTRKPLVVGPQAAEVVGPTGTEIHVDSKGRVLVKLEWDESPAGDLTCACWMPVSQGSSGAGYGSMLIPRVGSFVLVEFLNGDPDRPIVTGRVFNSQSPYPYALPGDKTKSALRTQTTPGGGGYNELRFEDEKGKEQVYLRAQRDLDIDTHHDATRKVGHDDSLRVDGARTTLVALTETQTVGLAHTVTVGALQTIAVAATRSLTVGGDHAESVQGSHQEVVGGDHAEEVAGSWSRLIAGTSAEEVGGNRSLEVEGDLQAEIGGNELREIAGSQSISVGGNYQQVVDGSAFLVCSGLSSCINGTTSVKGTGEVLVESETVQKIGAPTIYVSASSQLFLRAGKAITLQVGDAKITIEDDHVYVTCGSSHKTLAGGSLNLNC